MTMIVTLRIKDVIIIASDTMALAMKKKKHYLQSFSKENVIETYYKKQKITSIFNCFGIAFANQVTINGKDCVNNHIQSFEDNYNTSLPRDLIEVESEICKYFEAEIIKENFSEDIKKSSEKIPIAYLFSGYTKIPGYPASPHTFEKIYFFKDNKFNTNIWSGYGIIFSAGSSEEHPDKKIIENKLEETKPEKDYDKMSILDGISLCKNFIKSTIKMYNENIINVPIGGGIDIALVKPENEFEWVEKHSSI